MQQRNIFGIFPVVFLPKTKLTEPIQPVKEYPKNDLYRYAEDKIKPNEQAEFMSLVLGIRAPVNSTQELMIDDEELAETFEGTRFQMLIVDFRTEYELRARSKSNRPPARTSPGVTSPNSLYTPQK